MNSALKPVLPQAGVQPAGQASPAKGNVANANHAVGLPQGAQNSLHHGNSLVGQNLTHHAPAPPAPPHPVPSMAPVSANMAQMAQNMSHHGNLSHVTQNSVAPTNMAASPNKSATTSAPLSLVQDKPPGPVVPPQPLALTRTPEKKEPDSTCQSNGTVESPKSASNAPAALKPQNPEPNKEKQDIAKTSPSTPKPPEKPVSAPSTPQKAEPAANSAQPESSAQPKLATANEAPEKSPAKPSEPKPAPAVAADVAPAQIDNKPPESANDNKVQEVAATPAIPAKPEPAPAELPKTEAVKPEEKKVEPVEKPAPVPAPAPAPASAAPTPVEEKKEEVKVAKLETPKKVEATEPQEKPQKVEEKPKPVEKKFDPKPPVAAKEPRVVPKSTLKLATVTTPMRKRRQASPKANEGPSPAKKLAEGDSTPDSRTKRNRTQVQLYQSPTPELTMATKLSASAGRATPTKQNDDKLIVFYKNEYLAVRNAEGGFYVCQAMQNVYRATRKIKIRWLSQDKSADPSGVTYKPDFYDVTDMECVLTTLSLSKAPSGGGSQILSKQEEARARSILQRALRAEQGGDIELTEEHPDGLDLSLYKDESQLEQKSRKRGAKASPRRPDAPGDAHAATPAKRARAPPRSPAAAPPPTPPKPTNKSQQKPASSKPTVASTSKTATAVTEKAKAKATLATPAKRTPVKGKETPVKAKETPVKVKETPVTPVAPVARAGRRSAAAAKESQPSPAPAPTPSTSTGKTSRRKPPQRK